VRAAREGYGEGGFCLVAGCGFAACRLASGRPFGKAALAVLRGLYVAVLPAPTFVSAAALNRLTRLAFTKVGAGDV
jgi:hypothetical protein